MNISECIDRAVKEKWRADLVNMLTDAGRTLEHTALRINGSVYQNINVGMLLLEAARSLRECQDEAEPEKPGDVGVKVTVTVPDQQEGERFREWAEDVKQFSMRKRWEAGANQIDSTKYGNLDNCAAAWKPVTNGDRIRAMTDEELADSDFSEVICDDIPRCLFGGVDTCRECRIKWLGSPVKEENHE